MALPINELRKIYVDGNEYGWIASGNDDYIDLIICDIKANGQKLLAKFDYHYLEIPDQKKMFLLSWFSNLLLHLFM